MEGKTYSSYRSSELTMVLREAVGFWKSQREKVKLFGHDWHFHPCFRPKKKDQIRKRNVAATLCQPRCQPHGSWMSERFKTPTHTHRKQTLCDMGTLEASWLSVRPQPLMTAKINTTAAARPKQDDALLNCSSKLQPLTGLGQMDGHTRQQTLTHIPVSEVEIKT